MIPHRTELIRLVVGGMLGLILGRVGRADEWEPPRSEYWSSNRQYVLNVGWPYKKTLTLYRTTPSAGKEELWSRPYVDDTWPPHSAYVADDGRHVVLRDVYHNLGYGKVLVFLGPKGKILRSFELADLLTQDQIVHCTHSVSSVWWSEPGWFALIDADKQFAFATHFGEIQCFDVPTGDRIVLDEKKRSEIRTRALRDILPFLRSTDAYQKARAARLCGALKATEAVPELKKLVGQHTPTSGRASGLSEMLALTFGGPNYSEVQVAAAGALISILKTQAVPLIEEQLADATPATREDLLNAIASLDSEMSLFVTRTPDSPFLLATWHRLSKSRLADVQKYAIKAVLARDEAQYVYDHSALLKDPDYEVRYRAVTCLVERGDKRAIPLLRTALQDSDPLIQSWAFSGLVRYQPDDILDILHRGLKHQDASIRKISLTELVKRADKNDVPAILYQGIKDKDPGVRREAMAELVRRGDKEAKGAVDAFVSEIAALKDHTHNREGWAYEHWDAVEMCQLVIRLELSAAEPALRQAYANECEDIRRAVCGALAALGDRDALRQLRQFTRVGDAHARASSIKMLSLVGDTASIPALREALDDREPWVREAAREAIARLQEKATGTRPTSPSGQR